MYKKKILYVATNTRVVNVFFVEQLIHLFNQGNIVHLACHTNTELNQELQKCVVFHELKFERNPFIIHKTIKHLNQLEDIVRKENFDIIHTHNPIPGFLTRLVGRKFPNIKIVYTAHGFHFYKGAPLLNWLLYYPLEKWAAKYTDCLLTINTEDYDIASTFKLRNNSKFIEKVSGVGVSVPEKLEDRRLEYRRNWTLEDDTLVILVLAELNNNKNQIQLIKAIKILYNKYKNIKVLLAGEGYMYEKLNQEIKQNNLENVISLLGFRTDVYNLIQASDVVGLFSKREGLGKCLIEGMSLGKPLIATNTRGPRELIEQGKNGFLVEIDDIQKTADCIETLLQNPELKLKFGEYSKLKFQEFSLANVLKQIDTIYNKIK